MGGPEIPSDGTSLWIHARSLGAGTIHLVNAGAVYAQTPLNTGGFENVEAGAGVGFTFRQACGDAILSLFAHEVLKRVAANEVNLTAIAPEYLANASVNIRYLQNVFGHMDRPFRVLGFTHEGSGSVALAFSPGDEEEPEKIAVGTAGALLPAAAAALTDLLALAQGSRSVRTVENYLPHSLGYTLSLSASEYRSQESTRLGRSNDQSMNSVLFAFGGAFMDIMIANLTNEDIRRCNLTAVKALFVRG